MGASACALPRSPFEEGISNQLQDRGVFLAYAPRLTPLLGGVESLSVIGDGERVAAGGQQRFLCRAECELRPSCL